MTIKQDKAEENYTFFFFLQNLAMFLWVLSCTYSCSCMKQRNVWWNTTLRLNFLHLQIRVGTDSFHLWLHVDPVLCSLSGIFRSIFRARLFNAFLIDCDLDQWLATTGLLSQYWIYSVSLPPLAWTASFLCLGPKEVLSMNFSYNFSVFSHFLTQSMSCLCPGAQTHI